jgi:hypothetical protein
MHVKRAVLSLSIAVAFFGLGVGTTLVFESEKSSRAGSRSATGAAGARPSQSITAEQLAAATALAALLANTTAAKRLDPSNPDSFIEMYWRARTDEGLRGELFDRYREAPDGQPKQILRRVLMGLNAPDVFAFFM